MDYTDQSGAIDLYHYLVMTRTLLSMSLSDLVYPAKPHNNYPNAKRRLCVYRELHHSSYLELPDILEVNKKMTITRLKTTRKIV